MLAFYVFWNPSETNMFPKCPVYAVTGIYCPGCGSQRAAHQILNGNLIEGLRHNYLIALLGLVLLYQAFMFIINNVLNKGITNLLHQSKVTMSILVIIILFWVLRNINLFPFTELAP
ncbi:DUF2752 domain-containing protein [Pontimicrobium aquaticum]|uniref:DUF2752 domain-containing protein n=1 Tax=Pontimicrobium aquaticum TaxID=2565367 RepID=A0A4U0EUI3_9FLAO|nr:DUF2752 domain-containing protein [Pontimicrobium aquaticum]TJY34062.1 DUF2752 domain-containing protein [Pontimicrobium aquaticum]